MKKELTHLGLLKSNLKIKRESSKGHREDAVRSEFFAKCADIEADEMERMVTVLEANGFTEEWKHD